MSSPLESCTMVRLELYPGGGGSIVVRLADIELIEFRDYDGPVIQENGRRHHLDLDHAFGKRRCLLKILGSMVIDGVTESQEDA